MPNKKEGQSRPFVIWMFVFVSAYGMYESFIHAVNIFSTTSIGTKWLVASFDLLLLIPGIIMLVNFFMLKKKVLLWVAISYGLYIILSLMDLVLGITSNYSDSLVNVALTAFVWWAVADYVRKKKVDGKPLFN